MAHTL